jgi:PAS domain S-box-containing protein
MESANELYREIVEQAPDGVSVASIEGTIFLWNDRAAELIVEQMIDPRSS